MIQYKHNITTKTISILLAILLLVAQPVYSLPSGPEVVEGEADIVTDGATMSITATDNTIINFNSFDIDQGESVIVNLPSVNSDILSRVIGDQASNLAGGLTCNGIFILVNTNGIYAAPTAALQAQGLLLSTLDITNQDFLDSNYLFQKLSPEQLDMLLINEGNITINEGGFAAFIGGAIENNGTIIVPLGTVALASGEAVRLDIYQGGLISVAIEKETAGSIYDFQGNPITDQIRHTGSIEADGGCVILNAESLPDIFSKTINLDGYIKATTFQNKDGNISLVSGGNVDIGGMLEATTIYVTSREGDLNIASNIRADDTILLKAPGGLLRSRGYMSSNLNTGTIIFKADSLDLGGTYQASYIDFDPVNICINNVINTTGSVAFTATNDIYVNANITTSSGSLTFTADSDNNDQGSFIQDSSTQIKTLYSGDIAIRAADAEVDKIDADGYIILSNSASAAMSGDITINDTLTAGGYIQISSEGTVDIRSDISSGGQVEIRADYDADGNGSLLFANNPTITAGTDSNENLEIYAANAITLTGDGEQDNPITIATAGSSSYATLCEGDNLYVYATGNGSGIEFTVAGDISSSGNIYLYSYDDLEIQADITASNMLTAFADFDNDGSGNLTFSNTPILETSGWFSDLKGANSFTIVGDGVSDNPVTLNTQGSATSATLQGGGVRATVTGEGDGVEISVTGSIVNTDDLMLYSYDDLDVQVSLTSPFIYLQADYNSNGAGNLTFTNNPTLSASAYHKIQSANALTLAADGVQNGDIALTAGGTTATLTGAGDDDLYIYATGRGLGTELTVLPGTGALSRSGRIELYAWDDCEIQADLTAGRHIILNADNDQSSIGNLTFANTPILTASASWKHQIQSANALTLAGNGVQDGDISLTGGGTQATLSGGNELLLYATGSGEGTELTVLSGTGAISKSDQLELYSWDDLVVQANLVSGDDLIVYADNDASGAGNLTFANTPTLTVGSGDKSYIKAANSLTLAGTGVQNDDIALTADGTQATLASVAGLYVYATGRGEGTELSVLPGTGIIWTSSPAYLYSWDDLNIQAGMTAGSSLYVYADYDNDGTGNLTFANTPTLIATGGKFGGGTHYIQAANALTLTGDGVVDNPITLAATGSTTTATLQSGAGLSATITGQGAGTELTIAGAILKSGILNLYSYGDLDIQETLSTSSFFGSMTIYADYNSDGTGNFIHTGGTISTTAAGNVSITGNGVSLGTISANSGNNNIIVNATGNITSNSASFTAENVVLKTTGGNVGTSATPIPITSGVYIDAQASAGSVYIQELGNTTIGASSSGDTGLVTGTQSYGGVAQDVGSNAIFNSTTGGLNLTVPGNLTIDNGVTFNPANGTISLSGNWTNSGTFNAGTGTVIFTGAGTSQLLGDNTFNNLTCEAAGKTMTFGAGSTQAIEGTMTLKASQGSRLILNSSTPGTLWNINPQGTVDVDYLDITNSNNTASTIYSSTSIFTDCIGWAKAAAQQTKNTLLKQDQIEKATRAIYIQQRYEAILPEAYADLGEINDNHIIFTDSPINMEGCYTITGHLFSGTLVGE